MPQNDSTPMGSLSSASAIRRIERSPSDRGRSKTNRDNNDGGSMHKTMREMISLMGSTGNSPTKRCIDEIQTTSSSSSFDDLYKLYDKHVNHLNFLKDNDLFSGHRKTEVMANIDSVYDCISKVSNSNRVRDDSEEATIPSNSNSSVS